MKPLFFKKMTIFPILLMYLLLITHPILSQTNSNQKRKRFRFERLIVNLRTTVEEGMIKLDNIDDNYLTKLSGLVSYDRVYLSKTSEKQFFSRVPLIACECPR